MLNISTYPIYIFMSKSSKLNVAVNLLLTVGIFLWASLLRADERPGGGAISMMKTPPVIDGKITAGEWGNAIKTEGFVGVASGVLDPRDGSVWVGCDENKLYIAISSELPPGGKLIETVKVADGPTIHDSSVELWVDPFLTERLGGESKRLPYYQFIGNSLGLVYDKKLIPEGATSEEWNGKWEIGNSIDTKKNRWEMEIAIAWKDLGIEPGTNMIGKKVGLVISRNWKRPWVRSAWVPRASFSDPMTYARLAITKNSPVVQIESLGDIFTGKFALKLRVKNPSEGKIDCVVDVKAMHSDMPTTSFRANEVIGAGADKLFEYRVKGDGFHPDAKHTVVIKVTSPDKKKEYFSQTLSWKFPAGKRWKLRSRGQGSGVKFAYYPSLNKMRFQIDRKAVLGNLPTNELRMRIHDKTEKTFFDQVFSLTKEEEQSYAADLPDFDDGIFTINFQFLSVGKEVISLDKSFERIHFPWEQNQLGISKKVYAPFTPIRVSGNKVGVVLRDYTLDQLGLPEKIIAKGHDILSSEGMSIKYITTDGVTHGFDQKAGKFIQTKDNLVVYEGQAESSHILLNARSEIEYDGCVKVKLKIASLQPDKEIKELYLDIPLKGKYAELWHIAEAGLRSNPAGKIPEGSGMVWNSNQTDNEPILGNFLPYIWLGRAEEGIAWFADSDKGWKVDDQSPEMQIIREGNQVVLRICFINTPVKLEKPMNLIFGWQASPTKPMPKDWRKPKQQLPQHGGSSRYWGIRPSFSGKYPAGRDYEFADQLLIARNKKKSDPAFLKRWYEKHYSGLKDPEMIRSVKSHISAGMNKATAAGRDSGVMMLYFEEHAQDQTTPEWRVFQDEWGCKDFTGRKWHDEIIKNDDPQGIKITPTPSYQDFAMWEEMEWLQRGIGIYCDNVFLRPSTNLQMSAGAYVRSDGNTQPGTGLWEMREYHKRMWVLTRQMREVSQYPLYISLHMTNGNLLPIVTWTDINLDIEWKWDGGNQPFPPDLLRAETIGRQTGSYPHALHQCTAKKWFMEGKVKNQQGAWQYQPEPVRHDWGIQMVHEIIRTVWDVEIEDYPLEKMVYDFGYGNDSCKVYNYWQDDYPLQVSNEKVKTITFENKGQIMVIMTSWDDQPCEVQIKLKGGLSNFSKLKAVDVETGKPYQGKDGKVVVPMKKWGVRLIVFAAKQ